jgi:predicted nucleotidyltransferase
VIESYVTIHGSHAYGLNSPVSDMDYRGFFFLTPEQFFGLGKPTDTYQSITDKVDTASWEFRKFVGLALNSNPNVLETLFTDERDVQKDIHGIGTALRSRANDWFLSRKVEITFGGYAKQQLTKFTKNIDKWDDIGLRKDVMHCVRLLYMAEQMLETGNLTVRFDKETDVGKLNFMLSIRRGQVKPLPVYQWCEQRLEALKELCAKSPLPSEPNHEKVNSFVQNVMFSMYSGGKGVLGH